MDEQVPIYCPICHRRLSHYESLEVSMDAVNTLIVWHKIPEDWPSSRNIADMGITQQEAERFGLGEHSPYNKMRTYCGRAGFKGARFD